MIETLAPIERVIVFKSLIHAIKTNSGIGFHNNDQGHPAYRMGIIGEIDLKTWGDSPEQNTMFQLLSTLSAVLGESERPRIESWEEFCGFAVDSYDQARSSS
jgi:hypothetical protein